MERFFLRIYDFFAGGRRWLAFLIPLVLLAGFWLCIRKISLNEDIYPQEEPLHIISS